MTAACLVMRKTLWEGDTTSVLRGGRFSRPRRFAQQYYTCVDKVDPLIEDCVEWTWREVVKEKGQTSDINKAICPKSDILYDCSKHYLQEYCNARTKDIVLEMVNTFPLPEPCTNNPPGRAGREPYQLVLSSASTSALSLGVLVVCLLLLSFLNH
ncbi:hypothetical protein ACOMHN_013722 [Nucella lapillus]